MVIIDSWYGRFSNNLQQLIYAYFIALKKRHSCITFPEHPEFSSTSLSVLQESDLSINSANIQGRFFTFADVLEHVPQRPSYVEMRQIAQQAIVPIMPGYKSIFEDTKSEREVVFHVRGGDIFSRRPHPRYVPPPCSYFTYYLNTFGNVGLIKEDRKHPVIRSLLASDYVTDLSSGSLLRDLAILGSANTIVVGPGTFWFSAFLLGKNLKTVILTVPRFQNGSFHDVWKIDGWPDGFEIKKNYLNDYISAGDWRNKFLQRWKIKRYKFEPVSFPARGGI